MASTGTTSEEEALKLADEWRRDRVRGEREEKEFYDAVERARIFVFESVPGEHVRIKNLGNADRIDLPFEVCAFEYFGGGSQRIDEDGQPTEEPLLAVLIHELAPKTYRFWAYGLMNGEGDVIRAEPHDTEQHLDLLGHVNHFLSKLPKSKIGLEQVKENIKLGSGKEKRIHTIRQLVRVVPKKQLAQVRPIAGKQIEWSHRWEVRGHWRELAGLGKNRDGEYCVKGMTWVKNCEKGPTDAPLIKKTRLVTDTSLLGTLNPPSPSVPPTPA